MRAFMKNVFSPTRVVGGGGSESEGREVVDVVSVVDGELVSSREGVVFSGVEEEGVRTFRGFVKAAGSGRGWGYVRTWWPTGQLPMIQVFMFRPQDWIRMRSAACTSQIC